MDVRLQRHVYFMRAALPTMLDRVRRIGRLVGGRQGGHPDAAALGVEGRG